MVPDRWLEPSLILPRLSTASVPELVRAVAAAMGSAGVAEADRIEAAFRETMRGEGFSLGSGVAIPHVELASLEETVVCLATLQRPLPLLTLDGQDPDVFAFVLSKPDPQAHLLLLAHLARLVRSRTLLSGLRRATTADEIAALVRATELRHTAAPAAGAAAPSPHALIVITVSGEKVVDALLVDLVDQGFAEACVVEAQSLREAAAHEVPLFTGFRDIFGDPGGRRVVLLEAAAEQVEAVTGMVSKICEEHGARDARLSVMPVQARWQMPSRRGDESAPGGH